MFTGIVEELGEITGIEQAGEFEGDAVRLTVRGPVVTADTRHGDSVAVNGVCLTATAVSGDSFGADVMKETLDRSSLGALTAGSPVNLERAAKVSDRLGGHIVQGHVDARAEVVERVTGSRWETVRFSLPSGLARYVVDKGSITVDGVSLTVASVGADSFTVSLIPTTLDLTTLGSKGIGAPVNLEADVIAKYVERLMPNSQAGA
ncbi:riboflavin synthase [Streptomonospora wellingtoniae]|uniref:Riboflavin synthase n=1 Tax=Streptomonospora wellingtoniae TaxID=3075544 RepID=A0ABU2KPD2_9ACTN|nr:riboflavin synthase [Streptomonospora sp. DSM 45055]MDT0301119.1 riboflavin synthase [Streptomonospora sp. DSM 45055]